MFLMVPFSANILMALGGDVRNAFGVFCHLMKVWMFCIYLSILYHFVICDEARPVPRALYGSDRGAEQSEARRKGTPFSVARVLCRRQIWFVSNALPIV